MDINSFLKTTLILVVALFGWNEVNSVQAEETTKTVKAYLKANSDDNGRAKVELEPSEPVPGVDWNPNDGIEMGYYKNSQFSYGSYKLTNYIPGGTTISFGVDFPYEVKTVSWGRFLYGFNQSASGKTEVDYNSDEDETWPTAEFSFSTGFSFSDLFNYLFSKIANFFGAEVKVEASNTTNGVAVAEMAVSFPSPNQGVNCLVITNDKGSNDVYVTHFAFEYYMPELGFTIDGASGYTIYDQWTYDYGTEISAHAGYFDADEIELSCEKSDIEIDQDKKTIKATKPGTYTVTATLYYNEEEITSKDFTITVLAPTVTIDDLSSNTLYIGESNKINVNIQNAGPYTFNTTFTGDEQAWHFVKVSSDGTLTAVGAGTATITAMVTSNYAPLAETTKVFTINVPSFIEGEIHTYGDDNNKSSLLVKDLISTEYDYRYLNDDHKYQDTYSTFAKLMSADNTKFKVGFQMVNFLTVPKWTSMQFKHQFQIFGLDDNESAEFGAELLFKEDGDYDNCTLNFGSTKSDYSIGKVDNTNPSNTAVPLHIMDDQSISNLSDTEKPLYIGLLSYVKKNDKNNIQTTVFCHKTQEEHYYYHALVTFHSNYDYNTSTADLDEYTYTQDISSKRTEKDKVVTVASVSLNCDQSWTTRTGYAFKEWNTKADGTGESYSLNGDFCPYDETNDCGKGPVQLYAIWTKTRCTITFDACDGNIIAGVTTNYVDESGVWASQSLDKKSQTWSIVVVNGLNAGSNVWIGNYQSMVVPNEDVTFDGWYTAQEGGTKVYDATFQAIAGTDYWDSNKCWIGTDDVTFYAHYIKDETLNTITLDANGGMIAKGATYWAYDNVTKTQVQVTLADDTKKLEIKVKQGNDAGSQFWNNPMKERGGFVFDGWYTEKVGGVQVYNSSFTAVNDDTYWKNKTWCGTSDVTLYARWIPMFTERDHVIYFSDKANYSSRSALIDIAGAITSSDEIIHAVKAEPCGWISNSGFSDSIKSVIASGKASANLLVYTKSYDLKSFTNVVYCDNNNYTCGALKITDKVSLRVPQAFTAASATYTRTANTAVTTDESEWGTVILPFPVSNSASLNYYALVGVEGNDMVFSTNSYEGKEIPAYTPLVYKRVDGVKGSEMTITASKSNVTVPAMPTIGSGESAVMNTQYTTNPIDGWSFVGTVEKEIYSGKDWDISRGDQGNSLEYNNMFYFKQNKFTQLSESGRVTIFPYRTYFIDGDLTYVSSSKNSKLTTFTLIAYDYDGATDITDSVNGEAGDGKIYDLGGRRVKSPVKGHVYIVNGKKKLYK